MSKYLLTSLRRRLICPLNPLTVPHPTQTCQSRWYSRSSKHQHYGMENKTMHSSSSSLITFAIPTVLLGFVGMAAYLHQNDERRAFPKGQGGREGIAPRGPTIGGPFKLITTDLKTFTEQDFLGKWVLLYFGYTSSPEIGPSRLQKMAKTMDLLESKQGVKILPVFVTIDPPRDNLSHLRAYLKEFDHRIVGLTGPAAAVKQMAQQYRVFFKKVEEDGNDYLVELSHNMYLINPSMEIVRSFAIHSNEEEMVEGILTEIESN